MSKRTTERIQAFIDAQEVPCCHCGAPMCARFLVEFGPVTEYLLFCSICEYSTTAYAEKVTHA